MAFNPGFVNGCGVSTGMLIDGTVGHMIKAAPRAEDSGGDPVGDLTFYLDRFYAGDQSPAIDGRIAFVPDLDGDFDGGDIFAAAVNKATELSVCIGDAASAGAAWYINFERSQAIKLPDTTSYPPTHLAQSGDDVYYIANADGATYDVYHVDLGTEAATLLGNFDFAGGSAAGTQPVLWLLASPGYWWIYSYDWADGELASIFKYARASATLDDSWEGIADCGDQYVPSVDLISEAQDMLQIYCAGAQQIVRVTAGVAEVINTAPVGAAPDGWFVAQFSDNLYFILLADDLEDPAAASMLWGTMFLHATGTRLHLVVRDLCALCDLAESQIDVGLLAGTRVRGYLVARSITGRSGIEPLQAAYFFDGVESDAKLKFLPRGRASVLTLTDDDLGATEWQPGSSGAGAAPPDLLPVTHAQELEMPRQITVTFINAGADYQQGAQPAVRQITVAKNVLTQELPIALTDAEAAAIADVLLMNAWQQRDNYGGATGSNAAHLDPGDVITVNSAERGQSYTLRLEEANFSPPAGVLRMTMFAEDRNIYFPRVDAAAAQADASVAGDPGPTTLALMDLPGLRDQDGLPGFYAAGCGAAAAWRSALLHKSADGGDSFASAAFLAGGVIGETTGALAPGDMSNTWDLASSVNVMLIPPEATLESVSDLAVYNGANACAIGSGDNWEVLQYAHADLQLDGSYMLSRLLRLRKGSDGTAPASLPEGSRFVLLSAGAIRVAQSAGEIGLERLYKAVTVGKSLDDTAAVAFTARGNALKPYAPVAISGVRNGAGDIAITGFRRDRLDNEWRDLVDVPMSEAAEAYEIDIMDGAAVVRTLSVSALAANYTAAQQTTDFGSPQPAVDVRVYQISAAVGRGFPAAATI